MGNGYVPNPAACCRVARRFAVCLDHCSSMCIVNDARAIGRFVVSELPAGGMFRGVVWRTGVEPFYLTPAEVELLERLGRVLLEFYRAANLLYRRSVAGQLPGWVADWLDRGKPAGLVALQRHPQFKNDLPRVIRPDILLTEDGLVITELDSVPGGIGLTAWLNAVYSRAGSYAHPAPPWEILGGARGMVDGFAAIFDRADRVYIMVSEECGMYEPEMRWLARVLGPRFEVVDGRFEAFEQGSCVYRFFELFDLANVPAAGRVFELAQQGLIALTPPPKPALEEKMLFAFFWNRHLYRFWLEQLGAAYFGLLRRMIPRTWLVDPTPLPPAGEFPELGITHWEQLAELSQTARQLVLKVSGFSPLAWGARGVWLGSDMPAAEWAGVIRRAIDSAETNPFVLQRYHKPRRVRVKWYDPDTDEVRDMDGRVKLSPFYFVVGDWVTAEVRLGGVLATICPADKKLIHGMRDAVLVPCARSASAAPGPERSGHP